MDIFNFCRIFDIFIDYNKDKSLEKEKKEKKKEKILNRFYILQFMMKLKSKSKILLIRFFYHLLGMLLVLIWRLELINKKLFLKDF